MVGSLNYIHVPAAEADGEAQRHVETLGAELIWKVRGMRTSVACMRVGEPVPATYRAGRRDWSLLSLTLSGILVLWLS
jgi:hypothetical protein